MPSQAFVTVPVEATAVGVSGCDLSGLSLSGLSLGIELLLILPR